MARRMRLRASASAKTPRSKTPLPELESGCCRRNGETRFLKRLDKRDRKKIHQAASLDTGNVGSLENCGRSILRWRLFRGIGGVAETVGGMAARAASSKSLTKTGVEFVAGSWACPWKGNKVQAEAASEDPKNRRSQDGKTTRRWRKNMRDFPSRLGWKKHTRSKGGSKMKQTGIWGLGIAVVARDSLCERDAWGG